MPRRRLHPTATQAASHSPPHTWSDSAAADDATRDSTAEETGALVRNRHPAPSRPPRMSCLEEAAVPPSPTTPQAGAR